MYGEDEFGAAEALEGLGAVHHVQTVMGPDPEATVTVQAQAVPAAQARSGSQQLNRGAGSFAVRPPAQAS